MKTFLVISTGSNSISDSTITGIFKNYTYTIVPNAVWMVASDDYSTPEGICTALGILPQSEENRTGIVVDLSNRNGVAAMDLVNTLHSWEGK